MYLRHSTVKKDGKTHTYWRLVRSVRRGNRVQQQTVACLGELDAQGRADARALALQMTGRADQLELFEEAPAAQAVSVRVDQVRVERGRSFGDVWLGWTLWRALQLDTACERLLVGGREAVPRATMAAVLCIARLCVRAVQRVAHRRGFSLRSLRDSTVTTTSCPPPKLPAANYASAASPVPTRRPPPCSTGLGYASQRGSGSHPPAREM